MVNGVKWNNQVLYIFRMSVIILRCILFVTDTGDAEYLKLSEVDSAVENFARDASNQCEDTAVSIFINIYIH